MLSRRSLLSLGATGAALTTLSGFAGSDTRFAGWKGKRPKNIIFCVADGMALQTVTIADYFQKLTMGHNSYWSDLLDNPLVTTGLQETRSLSSVVTDSAAASSAWGTGRLIWNGQLGMYPDGTSLRTLSSLMIEKGVKVGLVTTTTITHATPAGFAINIDSRDLEGMIAEQYLKTEVSVLMGGGNKSFDASLRKDKRDLYNDFAKQGFKVAKTRDEILGLKADKILGIFSDSHVPFSVDRNNDSELQKKVPTLAEMTTVAIDNLKDNKNGFLLQIEGGKVDHAAHGNDFGGMLHDQIAFEEAVKVAVEFAIKDKETLVIITSDHACGGPSLNGAGDEYGDTTQALINASRIKASYETVRKLIGKSPTVGMVQDVIKDRMGYGLKTVEAQAIVDAANGKSPFAFLELQSSLNSVMALVLQNHTKVGFTSNNHTNDHVLVSAFGPGSEQVRGITRNVEFFDIMCAAKGIKWSNPTMTYEVAAKAMSMKREDKKAAALAMEMHEMYASHDDECGCQSAH